MSFAAWVLKDVKNFQPIFDVSFQFYLVTVFPGNRTVELGIISLIKTNAIFPLPKIQWISQTQQCYISSKMHHAFEWHWSPNPSFAWQFDSFPSLDQCEKKLKKWHWPVLDQVGDSEEWFIELYFWITDWTANNEQSIFSGEESILKGLPFNSKAASGYFGKVVWYWINEKVSRFEKVHPDTHNKHFM